MTSTSIDILLAEDDQPLRDARKELLHDAGYSVEAVANGRDALEWLHDAPTPPKLILLDLMMPVMDGWQFVEAQQKAANTASIPVVVLSAGDDRSAVVTFVPDRSPPVDGAASEFEIAAVWSSRARPVPPLV